LLEDSLLRVADQLEKDDELRRQVKTAMIYPGVIITFALLVLLALVAFIVPSFVGVFKDFGGELPAITKFTVLLSTIVTSYWYVLIVVSVGSFVGFAPAEDPAVVVGVALDEPRPLYYGGLTAGPVFADIMGFTLNHRHVPPSDPDARSAAPVVGSAGTTAAAGEPSPLARSPLPRWTRRPALPAWVHRPARR